MWHWGDTGLGQELVLGCRWHWELQEKEHQQCHHPWSQLCTSGNQLCLPGLSSTSNIDLEPGIFLNIFLRSLRRYTAWNREKTKKCTNAPGNFCLDPAAGIDCHQKPPAWQSTPGFVFVGRKKTCSVSHSVSTSLLASVKLLRCYRWDSVTEVLSLKPSKFWVFMKRSKFWVFMDILMKWLSMMANTFSPKQCVVMHVCSVHHAHGGVRLWLL